MNIGGKKVPNWAVYGGVGVLVVGGVLWYRNKSASSPASAASGTTDPNLIDPTTGVPYADETAGNYAGYTQGISGYGYGFPTSDITGGTTVGSAYTSNAQWAQAVEAGLTAIGYDAAAVGAAVGKYLLNMPLTGDQVTIVQTAVAEFGPPPVGTFAIIAGGSAPPPPGGGTPSGGGGAGGSGGGGAGGSGGGGAGGGAGSGAWSFPAPGGLHSYSVSDSGFRLAWNPVTGPGGQHPTGYRVQSWYSTGQAVDSFTVTGTSTAEYGAGGHGLKKGSTVRTEVTALGSPQPSHAASMTTHILSK